MEENPFVFGKSVEGDYFTDREEETRRLEANLTHGINTVLISPRRWGKTSLVKRSLPTTGVMMSVMYFLTCSTVNQKVFFTTCLPTKSSDRLHQGLTSG